MGSVVTSISGETAVDGRHPDISVIVPVYNARKTLSRCVESLLAQTYPDFEILLVDDGSTDASLEICRNFADSDPRVKVFSKPNGGVSSARNLGLDSARGKYIAFCDSDDCTGKDWLMSMRKEAGESGMVMCGYHIHYAVPEKGLTEENIGMPTDRPVVMSDMTEILEKTLNAARFQRETAFVQTLLQVLSGDPTVAWNVLKNFDDQQSFAFDASDCSHGAGLLWFV